MAPGTWVDSVTIDLPASGRYATCSGQSESFHGRHKMNPRVAHVVRVSIRVALGLSAALQLFLARVAYLGSRDTGGAAAQGDLGFYMELSVLTVPVLLGTVALWWIDRHFVSTTRAARASSKFAGALAAVGVLTLGWNWLYLLNFWKA